MGLWHGGVGLGEGAGLGLWHGGVGLGDGAGLGLTTGGTPTGGTTTGGVTVGGTTVGGMTTGGTTMGGTTAGGVTAGGVTTGRVTSMVTGSGLTGLTRLTGCVGFEEGKVVTAGVGVVAGPVDAGGGMELVTVGVGLTDGVDPPEGAELCCFGTTMSELPPDWVGEPKLAPAAGWCEGGETTAFEPMTITLTVAAVVSPTNEIAATRVLTGVAAKAPGRWNAALSFTAATPPRHQAVSDRLFGQALWRGRRSTR